MFRLNRNDLALLATIAEHRILSLDHLAMALGGNKDAVGKRARQLEESEWLVHDSRGYGRGRGRPEKLLSISPKGVQLLRDRGQLPEDVCTEQVTAVRDGSNDHLLLLNWLLLHLAALGRNVPFLTTHYLSSASPFIARDKNGLSLIYERIKSTDSDTRVGFEPDAAFSIHHQELGKSLLFFLEVDMATEDLSNPDRSGGDVRHKILCYQQYFEHEGYKRYQSVWNTNFNGFRLLFLANTLSGLSNLCRLVREMPPSDFVWLMSVLALFEGLRITIIEGLPQDLGVVRHRWGSAPDPGIF